MNIKLTCEKSEEILKVLLGNTYYNSNIINCVLLLKKFNTNSFELTYDDETIIYKNGKLIEYSNQILEYKDKKLNIIENNHAGNYEIQEFLRKKELLDKTNSIEINKLDSLIIGSYRLFCDSNPDLSKQNIKDRIQVLAYFLSLILSPIQYSTYFTRFNGNMPYNELIEYEMDKLEVLSNEELNSLVISDKIKNVITHLMTKLNDKYNNYTLLDLVKLHHNYYSEQCVNTESKEFIQYIKKQ